MINNIISSNYLPPIPPLSNISNYINYVYKIPFLSSDEEYQLAIAKDNNDRFAAQILIVSQLKTVVKEATKFLGYGFPIEDLIQEGNIGLMRAVKSFDARKGVRLITYAINWIRGEIKDYISSNWGEVKIATTKEYRKLFFKYKSLRSQLEEKGLNSLEIIKEIKRTLNVSEDSIREIEERLNQNNIEISDPYFQIANESNIDKKEKEMDCAKLVNELEKLKSKEKHIIENKYVASKPKTNKEIAKDLEISDERVRQIENIVIERIKKALN